ncbi:Type I phosphodiesterase / nucleotide pyrophosphatase [Singulisphaera sp. GP187]|uniref:alkaline phosphatase family protein n=1 Tax=Singulisphaera sp. GP187 TaxID=1882752 RepID=UPI0009274EED|nr:alkaline phosphatase family protein [Singulisphaera sp. GP187]SIO26433.1 Type I phosphodiesterase / nucleotide pyrophosphatase [Singulisphaera sp. GP187]
MMTVPRFALALALAVFQIGVTVSRGAEPGARPPLATRNVVLVTTDGLRWQEVFRGAEESLINKKDGGVANVDALRRDYWRDGVEARREALMPFLWKTVAREGQLYGNADKGSPARVTNGKNFSYPGYNELLTGAADARINSNDKVPNSNVSVLEWLNHKPGYQGKVETVGSWDLFPYILNVKRSGLSVNAGWEALALAGKSLNESQVLLNQVMMQSPRLWEGCRHDAFTFPVAMETLKHQTPRVLYLSLGDTDEFSHGGRYDHYLRAAHDVDANLKQLWDTLQSRPEYRDTTTMIVTTDHGRGDPPRGWRDHGENTKGSDAIWVAVLGPDTPALGERKDTAVVTQSQVAATLAAFLGEDYCAAVPAAAPPIAEAIGRASQAAAVSAQP